MTDPTRMEWEVGRELAFRLIRRHPELLKQVPPLSDILFVLDKAATPKKDGRPVLARVSKIPAKFEDFVYEGDKQFILEWFTLNVHGRTINQQQVIMVHELLHFEYDEDKLVHRLRGHDFEDFRVLMDRFGYRWSDPRIGDVPDILARDFEWGKQGQARLDLQGAADQVAQETGREVTVAAGGQEATGKSITLASTEKATLHVPGNGPPTLEITGPNGTRQIPATDGGEKGAEFRTLGDGWQLEKPLVTKDNVIPLRQATGTDQGG